MKYGLSDEQLKQVLDIIATYDEIEKAILFGSRAIDTYKEASDVDIALKGTKVTASLAAKLKFHFEEDTYLPFFFDFIAYPTITNEALKEHIDTKGVVIYRKGWRGYRFSDFVIINSKVKLEKGKKYSFVEMKDLTDGQKKCYPSQERILSGGSKFQNGDTLFARITPCLENGKICQVNGLKNGVGFGSTEFYVFKEKENVSDNEFVFYLSRWSEVRSFAEMNFDGTSGRQRVPKSSFDNLFLNLSPLPEQKAIASVLSSLDDKIDLLHRQNKTLEAMAETLFRQWFVEEAQDEWDEISLGECCKVITKGTTPTTLKKQFVSEGINFIKVNCIDENGNFLIGKFQFIDEETNNVLRRSKLEEGDILYSIAGTIGRLIIVAKDILPANTNQALAIIRVNPEKINPIFIKYCLKDREITENLHSKVVHAVQPNLSLGEISKTCIPYPPEAVMKDFETTLEPIELKLGKNKFQIRTLEKLRDTLLPKLMSGEVRVEYEN